MLSENLPSFSKKRSSLELTVGSGVYVFFWVSSLESRETSLSRRFKSLSIYTVYVVHHKLTTGLKLSSSVAWIVEFSKTTHFNGCPCVHFHLKEKILYIRLFIQYRVLYLSVCNNSGIKLIWGYYHNATTICHFIKSQIIIFSTFIF